jgi:hypothetical protein
MPELVRVNEAHYNLPNFATSLAFIHSSPIGNATHFLES